MKLVEEEINQKTPSQILSPSQNIPIADQSFLSSFKTFQSSVKLSITIHFIRFISVSLIYFFSDIFLQGSKGSSQPWNSLIYLLAMMIEIIKFIGDCTLRNLLRNEQKKLIQIHKIRNKSQLVGQNNQNIALKGGQYEDYLHIFSLVRMFKLKHINYSTAFTISKRLHLVCTFLLFGWMSFRQQSSKETGFIQFIVLGVFLYSIYFTSFEIDLFLIETSQGKYSIEKNRESLPLSQNEIDIAKKRFIQWRTKNVPYIIISAISILLAIVIQSQWSTFVFAALVTLGVNIFGIQLQRKAQHLSYDSIKAMKRQIINTYSLLKKSTLNFTFLYKIVKVVQRATIVWFIFFFARDLTLNWYSSLFYTFAIFLLIMGQIQKFKIGNQLKLLSITEGSYTKHNRQMSESNNGTPFQCSICLNSFQQGQKVKFLPCSKDHIYHSACFDDWKKIKKQCPLCRYSLKEYI